MYTILAQPNRHRVSTDRLNHVDSQMVPSLERGSDPYTRRKDPPTLIHQTQVSEGEGTRYENNLKDPHYNSNVNVKNIINT